MGVNLVGDQQKPAYIFSLHLLVKTTNQTTNTQRNNLMDDQAFHNSVYIFHIVKRKNSWYMNVYHGIEKLQYSYRRFLWLLSCTYLPLYTSGCYFFSTKPTSPVHESRLQEGLTCSVLTLTFATCLFITKMRGHERTHASKWEIMCYALRWHAIKFFREELVYRIHLAATIGG